MSEMQGGGCLCGEVRYNVSGAMRPVIYCHCQQCRRTSGHHVAATSAPREAIAIQGEPVWYVSTPGTRRGFCGRCGANLFWDSEASTSLSIFAGTLDNAGGLAVAGHIFCADKGAYYEIMDGLPQADAADAMLTTQVPKDQSGSS